MKTNLMGFTVQQMEALFVELGEKPYRGKQLFKWLYNDRQREFDSMTTLSKDLRARLDEQYAVRGLQLEKHLKSTDGTEKFLFRLDDGHPIESVLIPGDDRNTVCISSQSGCALGCRFCATGMMGLKRNLSVGEIVGQLIFIRELYGDDSFTNVVFMGMGEPLQNYDSVIETLRIMTDSLGLGVGAKKIVISTVGIPSRIRQLADDNIKTRLSLSLHAATQEKRLCLMPIAKSFPLEETMEAVRYYTQKTGFRVSFEYVLFGGFNDEMEDVKALTRLVRGLPCKINLIAYNEVKGLDFRRPDDEKIDWFAKELYPRVPAVTVRKSRGRDIDAACGQLAARR